MYICGLEIQNFGSFSELQKLAFTDGINIIVGENNAGKTTILDAIQNKKRNPHIRPEDNLGSTTMRIIRTLISVNVDEIHQRLILLDKSAVVFMFAPINDDSILERINTNKLPPLVREMSSAGKGTKFEELAYFRWNENFEFNEGYRLVIPEDGEHQGLQFQGGGLKGLRTAGGSRIEDSITAGFKGSLYAFDPQRVIKSIYKSSQNEKLLPDGANLPEVLHNLEANRPLFQRYLDAVQGIFPDILDIITVVKDGASNVEIRVKITAPSSDTAVDYREDSIALEYMGTGVGQVLAILYVLLTAKTKQVFLIEDPQNFLHPRAIRSLFDVIRNQEIKHQFIMTTHSTLVISAADPDNIILLEKDGTYSKVTSINKTERRDMLAVLHGLGVSFSDVFGAKEILWVEGKTEEECIPRILQAFAYPLFGVVILGVINTGDLDGKHKRTALRIYHSLSGSNAFLPPALGFLLDREDRSHPQVDQVKELGPVEYLPYRMFENYLLHYEALAAVFSEIFARTITSGDISNWIDANLYENEDRRTWKKKYGNALDDSNLGLLDSSTLEKLDGAKVLNDMLYGFSQDNPQSYRKVNHGIRLTEWLLENDPNHLRPLYEFVVNCLDMWKSTR